jgi:(4S)-4-hydroxy-5-phosphonooxypentane-2,3-dione isomerase
VIVHTAHLRVRPEALDKFRARLLRHAQITLANELGCSRFDVHQERSDPTLFLLVEHSTHYLAFREDVKDWVSERTWWYWTVCAGSIAVPRPDSSP